VKEGEQYERTKKVLIGAGSMFFGRQFIWSVVHSEALSKGTITLVNTDRTCLDKMMKLARMATDSMGTDTKYAK
jgi:alpha-galactosidase